MQGVLHAATISATCNAIGRATVLGDWGPSLNKAPNLKSKNQNGVSRNFRKLRMRPSTIALQVAKIDVTQCNGYKNSGNRCKKVEPSYTSGNRCESEKAALHSTEIRCYTGNRNETRFETPLRHKMQKKLHPVTLALCRWSHFYWSYFLITSCEQECKF